MINYLILMAGKGSRFEAKGYTDPKPFISMGNKTMIATVVENLVPKNRKDVRFIFMVQKEHQKKYDVDNILKSAIGDLEGVIVTVDGITQGAACTALLASDLIDNDDELIIANSDQLVEEGEMFRWNSYLTKMEYGVDGVILGFESNLPKWSYVSTDVNGIVTEVAEKKCISTHATVGIYYYKKGRYFVDAAKDMIRNEITTNNEYYVCPVFNEMILNGKKIEFFPINANKFHGIGDPESLTTYLNNHT